mmetsp:Transcript_29047/g.42730  ORF Transcript_29047/g.42730 Transcript_29047/m.42730 type:complete len:422 (-) Transcript_29047:155-1420(-)
MKKGQQTQSPRATRQHWEWHSKNKCTLHTNLLSISSSSSRHLLITYRIDAEELKKLLRKHNSTFTDHEIVEIGELFYAGKAGGSVTIDGFIEAVDYVAANNQEVDGKGALKAGDQGSIPLSNNADGAVQHFKDSSNHPMGVGQCAAEYFGAGKSHGHYTAEELDVKLTHVEPKSIRDTLAFNAVKAMRFVFDTATGWKSDDITTSKILNRVIYLETVAAVPGMVAAIVRHFKSLRTMQRDGGLLQMFLEEANNERMHLLSFVRLKDPNTFFRAAVIGGQLGFGTLFLAAYMVSPKFCHRFVGYIEEEACDTYTKIVKAIEDAPEGSELAQWKVERAPKIAQAYWKLGEDGTILDLVYAVRADEAEHRDVNHLVSGMKEGQINPLYDPQAKLDQMLLKYVKDIMTRPEASTAPGGTPPSATA